MNLGERPGTASPTGRLAPSPTGGLHLGHARSFLAAWLFARTAGGRLVLRIEDIDTTRARSEAIQGAIDDVRWIGLDWDEGPDLGGPNAPYLQSQRMSHYDAALARLIEADLVYPCTCTRAEIARAASAPHAEDEAPTYPGFCANRRAGDASNLPGRSFAWRLRVPPGNVEWVDLIRGRSSLDPSSLGGDFIVARAGVGPSYQLAVVVDDAAMGVSQVIRGDDLVPSTPRQILLHEALGFRVPEFGHLPLVHGPDGRRLAKRDGSIKLATLRAVGLDPGAFRAWLARSLGVVDASQADSLARWASRFDPSRIPRHRLDVSAWEIEALSKGSLA